MSSSYCHFTSTSHLPPSPISRTSLFHATPCSYVPLCEGLRQSLSWTTRHRGKKHCAFALTGTLLPYQTDTSEPLLQVYCNLSVENTHPSYIWGCICLDVGRPRTNFYHSSFKFQGSRQYKDTVKTLLKYIGTIARLVALRSTIVL